MRRSYRRFAHLIDIDRFEEAIGFEPIRQAQNKHGETEDIGHCPDPWQLHKNGDTTGKFAINREKKLWNCFVCQGGDLLSLITALQPISEQEGEEWLYQLAKADVSDGDFLAEIDAILADPVTATPIMPWFNERVLDPWIEQVSQIEEWLAGRGIDLEVADGARLGYQANGRRLGPQKAAEATRAVYEGPCLYLPHFWGERLVGWQQRWMDPERPKWLPKYTNTSGFPKTETLYNFENVYLAQRPVIVCESVMTVLMLTGLDYPAIATFGASVSEEQMRLLRRFTQGLVLAPDNDAPGRKWTGRSDEQLTLAEYLARYVPVKVIEPVGEHGSGNDLGDLIDEGYDFACEAVEVLYEEAEYYA